jgi:hypothetical protein
MLALAVAAQGFALAQTCPWLHPAWTTTLALAASVATLPVVHARRFAVALAASLSLTVVVFSMWGTAVGALVGALEWTRADGGGWSLTRLLAAAVWWWALHVPVVVMRWRTQAMPADDAAREVVAALGASLLATAGLLVTTSAASWWATVGCVALAVGALKWAWRKHSDEDAAAARSAQPGEGRGAPYRAQRSLTPAKMSWGRWALFWAMVAWCGAVVRWGAWRLPHVGPRGQWAAVATAMRTVRVGDDPCGVGLGPEGRREFTWRYGTSERVTVWPSGAVTEGIGSGDCGAHEMRNQPYAAC